MSREIFLNITDTGTSVKVVENGKTIIEATPRESRALQLDEAAGKIRVLAHPNESVLNDFDMYYNEINDKLGTSTIKEFYDKLIELRAFKVGGGGLGGGGGTITTKPIIEVSGNLPDESNRKPDYFYELLDSSDTDNYPNGTYKCLADKSLIYLGGGGGGSGGSEAAAVPTEVTSYDDITNGNAGIYYLTQVDGTHQIGEYIKLSDNSIIYKKDAVQSDIAETNSSKLSYVKTNNLPTFTSLEDATNSLGAGRFFLFAENNTDGVVSPNGSVVGITQEIEA